MPCFRPRLAFPSNQLTKSGKRKYVFNVENGLAGSAAFGMKLACRQCMDCRLDLSRQWAIRCMHEASLYDHNHFVTLTYAPKYLPNPPSLDVREFQLFMKRLRKKFPPGIRYLHCGEYGERFQRPHYHAILFNLNIKDLEPFSRSGSFTLYTSKTLTKAWGKGNVIIGSVTLESAGYVARYCTKKVTGKEGETHLMYTDIDPVFVSDVGPVLPAAKRLKHEYATPSNVGLGHDWFMKYKSDLYPNDFVVIAGQEYKVPAYYDRMLLKYFPDEYDQVKRERRSRAIKREAHRVSRLRESEKYDELYGLRLKTLEKAKFLAFKKLIRGLDNDL